MKISFLLKTLSLGLISTVLTLTVSAANFDATDLVIYYSFDADTLVELDKDGLVETDVLDKSGNGNNGFLHGNNLKIVEGKVKECLELPGAAAEYVAVRNLNYVEGIPELSMAAWIKTSQRGIIASWDRSEFFRFGAGDDQLGNTTFVAFDICCPIRDWHGEVEVTDDQWHHVAVTFDAETKRIYVDGELDMEAPTHTNNKLIGPKAQRYGFIGVGSEAATFGGPPGPVNWPYKGLMDEFLLFHRALSEDEVTRLAKARGNPFAVEPDSKLSTTWAEIKNVR